MKKLILIIGILAVFITCYNTVSGESIKSNLAGFVLGIGLIITYFESYKSKKLRK